MRYSLRAFYALVLVFMMKASFSSLYAQTGWYLTGKVISASNNEPVSFATVYLKSDQTGIYTNAEGDFKIPAGRGYEEDSLIVTSIGFRRKSIDIRTMIRDKVNRITLEPATYSFQEIKVIASKNKLPAEAIVKKAIRKILNNYPVKRFSYVSYYRDYQKKDSTYYNLNEGLVRTWDKGFQKKFDQNLYSLLDFRKNLDFLRLNLTPYYDNKLKYVPDALLPDNGGNELITLMVHDAIRNYKIPTYSFIYRLSYDLLRNHTFTGIEPVFNNNLLLYKIPFIAKHYVTGDSVEARGNIYIQPGKWGIHKLDYSAYYLTKIGKGKEMFSISSEYGFNNSTDSLLRLKYISFKNMFRVADTSDLYYFKITDVSTDDPYTFLSLIIRTNNIINPESAYDTANYKITYNDSTATIKKISVSGKTIMVILNYKSFINMKPKLSIMNIRDIYGNILYEKKYSEYYQYRELFVENYDKATIPKDTCFVYTRPLEFNCRSKPSENEKYWMNTPLNAKPINGKK